MDLIDRSRALVILRNQCTTFGMIRAIQNMPSAERTARWEYEEPNGSNSFKGSYWCSNCHQPETFRRNYCPECGARMEG